MSWLCRILIVLLAAAGLIGQATKDVVHLQNGSGNENGLLVWGQVSKPPKKFTSAVNDISIGNVEEALQQANEVVAFTLGRPPVLSDVTWTSGPDVVTLEYQPVVELDLKIWVLCANSNCTGGLPPAKEGELVMFLVWANSLLEKERTGIALRPAATGLISDLTKDPTQDTRRSRFGDFDPSSDCNHVGDLTDQMKEPNAFNIYMVGTVGGLDHAGHSCSKQDVAVVGSGALKGTILHEIGHNLSLNHIDYDSDFKGAKKSKNLMFSNSSQREFVSEGQVFRMHFSDLSALNVIFSSPAGSAKRDCDTPTAAAPCPKNGTWLWPDK